MNSRPVTKTTNIDDPIAEEKPQNGKPFQPNFSLFSNPSSSENYNDSDDEYLQLQTIHET